MKLPWLQQVLKHSALWLSGGLTYGLIEILWRGYTHWTMVVLGGLLFLALGGINEYLPWEMPLWLQSVLGAVGITLAELMAGVLLNIFLGLNVWDYSHLSFHFLGQISLLYFFLWIPVALFGIWLDDVLRWRFFGEDKPHYVWVRG